MLHPSTRRGCAWPVVMAAGWGVGGEGGGDGGGEHWSLRFLDLSGSVDGEEERDGE